jgi:hypothetical protein
MMLTAGNHTLRDLKYMGSETNMFKEIARTSAAVIGALAITSIGLPAHAFTPTMSEVRFISGPASDDSLDGLALTSDAAAAVVLSGGDAWVVDVATNTSTSISTPYFAHSLIIDDSDTFAYIAESAGTYPTYTYQVSKVSLSNATVVSTWPDADFTFAPQHMFWSADALHIYMVGNVGNYPNYSVAVAKLNVGTGAITQQVWGDGDPGYRANQPAFDTVSGKIMIPYSDVDTGLVTGFTVYNTATDTVTDIPWVGDSALIACDSQSGVVACLVDDTEPYIATINSSGAVVTSLDLNSAVVDAQYVRLTPDASQAYVYGEDGDSSVGNVEVIDLTLMSSVMVFYTTMDYPNLVVMAPDAGQIWFTADYIEDYNGGYRVVQFADVNLADTGPNPAIGGALSALSVLALAVGVAMRFGTRRQQVQQ